MSRLPRITADEFIKAIGRAAFERVSVAGSHAKYVAPGGRRVVVPLHSGRTIHPSLLTRLLLEADLSTDELSQTALNGQEDTALAADLSARVVASRVLPDARDRPQ